MPHTAQPEHTIHIHPQAPAKVQLGAPCNGCGVCCLFAPCPLGILLSRRRSGACDALRWDESRAQYRCGAITQPHAVLRQSLPRGLRGLSHALAPLLRRMGLRWIAADIGCDSSLELDPDDSASTTMSATDPTQSIRAVARRSPP